MEDNNLKLVINQRNEYYVDSQGRKQGKYKEFSEKGNILIISNYVDDLLDGEYIEYHYNMDIIWYKCNYSNGLKEGGCIYYYESKKILEKGNYVNNNRDGYWKVFKNNEQNELNMYLYFVKGILCEPPPIQVKNAGKKI